MTTQILNYGGGTQTMAMLVLVKRGLLPKPDYVIAADTGREMPTTWEYAEQYARPLLVSMGMDLHIASHDLATVDIYPTNGAAYPILPVYMHAGKMNTYCSSEWKARVVQRYARKVLGIDGDLVNWIGFASEERKRVKGQDGRRYPLLDLMLTSEDCRHIILSEGLPLPKKSRCWCCPHQHNTEWNEVKADPMLWQQAVALDEELRENDERGGVFLHEDRIPLVDVDLDAIDRNEPSRQCGLGLCFV